jgi:23S rRNA G2445 N2-methylase RlmL
MLFYARKVKEGNPAPTDALRRHRTTVMAKSRPAPAALPPCYAMVLSGLETVAGDEIQRDLGGEVKRTTRGLVVFRVAEINDALLRLRTVEDVFLLAWGTDRLSYRADALEQIRRWTAREADWSRLLRLHHAVRPKPTGKPTYRLVTQMTGEHGFRRVDAREALARGLAGKFPASWRPAEENAAVEFWLTIQDSTAVCGLRLSDRTMRHRTYKAEHLPASLRPTLAAAMVRLAGLGPSQVLLDPMCGAGTILAEALWLRAARGGRRRPPDETGPPRCLTWGGDLDAAALRAAGSNLRRLGQTLLARWDARRLPLPDHSVDRVVSNPPFGKQIGRPEEIGPLYGGMIREFGRVLRPGGRAVLLTSATAALADAARAVGWKRSEQLRVRVLGQAATLTVWRKE